MKGALRVVYKIYLAFDIVTRRYETKCNEFNRILKLYALKNNTKIEVVKYYCSTIKNEFYIDLQFK